MKKLIAPQQMLACERAYFCSSGVPSIEVMERAAQELADVLAASLPAGVSILFVCGTGGNGGDGTACARILSDRYRCAIVQPKAPRSPDAIENLRRAQVCGIPVFDMMPSEIPAAIVDALFGTGLNRAPEGAEADLIRRINEYHDGGVKVFSADIPSGLNGADGHAYDPCICADATVTFQYLKTGMVLADGLDHCGAVTIADVGFPDEAFPGSAQLIEPEDIGRFLPKRPRNIHKGTCGHLLIVAGSFGMAGAAAMCARAALRSGVGLVSIACVRSIVPMLQMLAPQAMCIPLEEEDGAIAASALPTFTNALQRKDAVVVGCGLTVKASPTIVEAVLRCGLPAVIDADGLNLLAAHHELTALLKPHHILTPHPGEAKRLVADMNVSNLTESAHRLATLGPTVLCKGAASAIADLKDIYISASGGCGMARGGSGDILSGVIGALLAGKTGLTPALIAALASEIHGLAGECAQRKYGKIAMNAADIIEFLPEVFKAYAE